MPLDTALIMRAMIVASELGRSWEGQQGSQNEFARLLEEYGLKDSSENGLIDLNSGGPRTYEAQLRGLGLIYKNDAGNLELTQAGEDMVSLTNVAETFQFQVLKYQYPSQYSMGRNVDIDRSIQIKPFLFLMRLASDPDINGLSDKDTIVPIVFGKTERSFQNCKNKILDARTQGIASVIPDDSSIRTAKTINNTFEERLKDLKDIANTFNNVLIGSGIANRRDINGETRLFPRSALYDLIREVSLTPMTDFLSLPGMQAIRHYGRRRGARRDNRRTNILQSAPELLTIQEVIMQNFIQQVALPASHAEIDEFISRMTREYHLRRDTVFSTLQPILSNTTQYAGGRLIELSRGGTQHANEFEHAITRVFSNEFGYQAEHTGQRVRPAGRIGGYCDVFVVEFDRNCCGIIDAKATDRYNLPHDDYAKMVQTYIPNVQELYGNRENVELKFVAYISHLVKDEAVSRAQQIYENKGIPVVLCSVYGLNGMRETADYQGHPEAVTDYFSSNSVVLVS